MTYGMVWSQVARGISWLEAPGCVAWGSDLASPGLFPHGGNGVMMLFPASL